MVRFLSGVEVSKDFSPGELEKIAAICRPVSFREEDVVLEEGARGRDLFIVRSGRVSITLSESPGRYDLGTITRCDPGQVVGELAFIDGARRSTWVIALERGEALRISWDDFSRLIARDLRIGYQFYRNMALLITERLRDTTMFCRNLLGMR
ncbi:MAG TPA: cyclic nucleotide-binding domain-containing protein [Syntrophobacteria bacterium]|nr:cyclic nucleotide-binding domain-containing protein [Syntrophobacteria bacterium]